MPFELSCPEVILIAAIASRNRAIGRHGTLPWHLPEDLARFKRLTSGHAVIVGRKTWQTDLGERALPGRHTIVLSATQVGHLSDRLSDRDDLCVAASLPAAFECVRGDRVFIMGGASVYAQTLAIADRLELTLVR
ncbi:MAG: dihydrofolate reductase, partial [Cyanobacteria bacterium J06648_11]